MAITFSAMEKAQKKIISLAGELFAYFVIDGKGEIMAAFADGIEAETWANRHDDEVHVVEYK